MKSKKMIGIFSICLIVLFVSLAFNIHFKSENKKISREVSNLKKNTSDLYEYLNSITVTKFKEKIDSSDDFYAYIGRPDCGDCILFEPTFISTINKYKLNNKILYMNVKKLRENQNEWVKFKKKYGFTQTPVIIHFSQGKNISFVEWDTEKGLPQNKLVDWFQKNNLIKK